MRKENGDFMGILLSARSGVRRGREGTTRKVTDPPDGRPSGILQMKSRLAQLPCQLDKTRQRRKWRWKSGAVVGARGRSAQRRCGDLIISCPRVGNPSLSEGEQQHTETWKRAETLVIKSTAGQSTKVNVNPQETYRFSNAPAMSAAARDRARFSQHRVPGAQVVQQIQIHVYHLESVESRHKLSVQGSCVDRHWTARGGRLGSGQDHSGQVEEEDRHEELGRRAKMGTVTSRLMRQESKGKCKRASNREAEETRGDGVQQECE